MAKLKPASSFFTLVKKISPSLEQIKRTEPKTWSTKKVINLLNLLHSGTTSFLQEPVYLVQNKDPFSGQKEISYLIYDGNTRHFLAEQGRISLDNFELLETEADLQEVRQRMKEIYWPGENLGAVVRYLRTERNYLIEQKKAA